MNTRKYDSESIQIILKDFCARQSNLIAQEVFDFIENNFTDMRSLSFQNPELFELNKQSFDDYIKRVYESEYYNRYIRIPKPLQDYLYVRDVVNEEVLNNRINLHTELRSSMQQRGLRRETSILDQRIDGEYK